MPLDNQAELFYWVDEQDNVLGKITRSEAHSGSMKIHRTVVVLLYTLDKKKLLLQQRSLQKDLDPGQWSISAGGHVTFPNDYQDSAQRELLEELGVSLTLESVGKFLIATPAQREITHIYTTKTSENTHFHFDQDEVQDLKWINVTKLTNFIVDNPFSLGSRVVLEKAHII